MKLLIVVALVALQCRGVDAPVNAEDRAVLERFLQHARERNFETMPARQRVAETACFFIGTPYRAGTLDEGEEERLVVNLREMDCVTFVDNVLALAMLFPTREGAPVDRFRENLRRVRYRDGRIDGLASRLHYSSDWLFEMQRQGILREVTRPENVPLTNNVSYLSAHHPVALKDPETRARLAAVEQQINSRAKQHLPKARVAVKTGQLQEGDIVLITAARDGLDTSHLGFALEQNGRVYLLHASSDARAVTATTVPLRDYLMATRRHAGIITARIIE